MGGTTYLWNLIVDFQVRDDVLAEVHGVLLAGLEVLLLAHMVFFFTHGTVDVFTIGVLDRRKRVVEITDDSSVRPRGRVPSRIARFPPGRVGDPDREITQGLHAQTDGE